MEQNVFHHREVALAVETLLRAAMPEYEVATGFVRSADANAQQILVRPSYLEQDENSGTTRTMQQTYGLQVELSMPGHANDAEYVMAQCARVVNALAEDLYLCGTCWFSQVTTVRYEPVTTIWVVAKRSEVWSS